MAWYEWLGSMVGSAAMATFIALYYGHHEKQKEEARRKRFSLLFVIAALETYAFECYRVLQEYHGQRNRIKSEQGSLLEESWKATPTFSLPDKDVRWETLDPKLCNRVLGFSIYTKTVREHVGSSAATWVMNRSEGDTIRLWMGAIGWVGTKALTIAIDLRKELGLPTPISFDVREELEHCGKAYAGHMHSIGLDEVDI